MGQASAVGSRVWRSEVRSQRPGVGGQESGPGVRGQESEVREPEVRAKAVVEGR